MPITIHSEGGAGEVTGSRHILTVDGKRYLIDCGAFQGKREVAEKKNKTLVRDPSGLESCVLTHAHFDHCGMLPLLVKREFKGNIFSTPATRDLANIIMMDSAHIQARDAEYLSKQAKKKGEVFDWKPLYDEKDVIRATSQFVTVSYNRPMLIGDGVTVELFDAGHILGSAMVRAEVRDASGKKVTIAFTGDLGRKNKPIIRDPQTMPPVDYVVLESTYGDRLHESSADALDRLAAIVNDTVKRGGKLIIPSFAIERTQELVYHFHTLVDARRIPEIPIYVDSPMAINATSIFQIHPECYDLETNEAFLQHHENPFGFNQLHFTSSVEESKAINNLKGPAIIISADGMCEAGRIQHHLINNVENPATTILIVGYMAEHTLGRRIRDRQSELHIHGEIFRLKARVEEINAFSAHADYQESWDWLSSMDLSGLKTVFLVHGEAESIAAFEKFLRGKGLKDVRVVKYGETYEL
ncbi:MAG: MBL fold metallo-hydrolase [Spirochaetes bacterium]|nr:MBL fold metallo-hydrolase [Spirochaetota bacterium]